MSRIYGIHNPNRDGPDGRRLVRVNAATVIKKAIGLIAPGKWTKGMMAADKDGSAVDFDSDVAEKFCAYGALARACIDVAKEEIGWKPADTSFRVDGDEVIKTVNSCLPGSGIWLNDFNDAADTKREDVEQAFVCALEKLETKPAEV